MADRFNDKDPIISRIDTIAEVANSAALEYQTLDIDTRPDLVEHADRTIGTVHAFAGKLLHPINRVVGKLHDVVDRFYNEKSHKYREDRQSEALRIVSVAVQEMNLSEEEALYLCAQLHDLIEVEVASGAHRRSVAKEAKPGTGMNGLPKEIIDMISLSYTGEIPSQVWLTTEPYLDFDHMNEVLYKSNIEAFITKASELIDNMQNPSSNRKSALFQDVLEAESFYAPILEVLGFDGLASVLRSLAHRIRLRNYEEAKRRERAATPDGEFREDGMPDGIACIEAAEEKIAEIKRIGIDNIAKHIFGDSRSLSERVVDEDSKGEVPIQIGNLLVDLGDEKVAFGHYRLKTIGSLANKLFRKKGAMPMDLMGMTVVSGDVEESARAFVGFIKNRLDDEANGLVAKKADSKEQPIYVQGSVEYVAAVRVQLEAQGIGADRVQFVEETAEEAAVRGHRKLEVAKVTFNATVDGVEVPTEIQFVTQAERERMRTGDVAHIIFKYLKQLGDHPDENLSKVTHEQRRHIIESAVKVLVAMHDRKQHLDPESLEINERSLVGALKMLRTLFTLAA